MASDLNRPRWRIPATWCAVAFAIVFPTIVTYFYFMAEAGAGTGQGVTEGVAQGTAAMGEAGTEPAAYNPLQLRYAVLKCIQFAFPLVFVLFVLRERPKRTRPTPSGLALGAAFGLSVAAAMMGLYYGWLDGTGLFVTAGQAVREKLADLGLDSWAKYVTLGAFYAAFHSLLEEYYWRWFVFGQLARLVRFWPAVAVSAVGFTLHHILVLGHFFGWQSPATYLFAIGIATGGAFWAWLYGRSESLYGPWLSHALVDAAIFWIGYDLARESLAG